MRKMLVYEQGESCRLLYAVSKYVLHNSEKTGGETSWVRHSAKHGPGWYPACGFAAFLSELQSKTDQLARPAEYTMHLGKVGAACKQPAENHPAATQGAL